MPRLMSGDDKTELARRRTRATIPSGVCVSSYGLSDTDVTLSKELLVLEQARVVTVTSQVRPTHHSAELLFHYAE